MKSAWPAKSLMLFTDHRLAGRKIDDRRLRHARDGKNLRIVARRYAGRVLTRSFASIRSPRKVRTDHRNTYPSSPTPAPSHSSPRGNACGHKIPRAIPPQHYSMATASRAIRSATVYVSPTFKICSRRIAAVICAVIVMRSSGSSRSVATTAVINLRNRCHRPAFARIHIKKRRAGLQIGDKAAATPTSGAVVLHADEWRR